MTNSQKLLKKFRITEDNLRSDEEIRKANHAYSERRYEFIEARKALSEAIRALHDLLDGPLRAAGHIPDGKDWTLKESDEDDSLFIHVWSEPKQRGRKKPEVPTHEVAFRTSNKAA